MNRFKYLVYTIALVIPIIAFSQTDRVSGKIRGKVFDASSKDPLVGANVVVLPASKGRGSMTNEHGEFVIPNILTGDYDLMVSYIGYSQVKVQGISVLPGQTVWVEFPLSVSALAGEEVVVIADAIENVVDVKSTVTQIKVSGEEISKMPVSDFTGVIASTGGVVETEAGRSSGIHIRGGRSGEIAYFVDGIHTNDPVDRSQGVEIDNEAIAEMQITTGGFSAEYGEAMSGIVNITTKSGAIENYSGSLTYETDGIFNEADILNNNYRKYNIGVGGPVFGLKKIMSFYISLTNVNSDIENPRDIKLAHSKLDMPQQTFKLKYAPEGSSFNAILSGNFSNKVRQNYSHSISKGNWLDSYYSTERGHRTLSLQLQNTLGKNTAWRMMFSYQEPYVYFGSGNNTSYKDFNYISSRLDWVNFAVEKGWYDLRTGDWSEITDENGLALISDQYMVNDDFLKNDGGGQLRLSELDPSDQAFYYYYFNEVNYFNIADGTWTSEADKVAAINQRWHEAGHWYIPAELDIESMFYIPTDSVARFNEFDDGRYAQYLLGDEPFKREHDLWGYAGNMHNGWSWDRDLFNVYTYGPGRPRSHIQNTVTRKFEFHISTQWSLRNDAKFGFKIESSNLRYMDIQFANANPYFDSYSYSPFKAASWLENKYEFEDFIATTGIRWDYFDPNGKALNTVLLLDEGIVEREKAKSKSQLSPRIGLNFSASDKTSISANYGYFFQIPEYGEIYQNVYADLTSGLPLIGNPDIVPEKTLQYQVGLAHKYSDQIGLEVTAFYKDVLNLLATRTQSALINGQVATVTTQEMEDFAKIKGIDVKLLINGYHNLTGDISYSYLSARGTGSSNREFYYLYIYESDRPLPSKEYPLEFDITHSLKTNLNYFIPAFGKSLSGVLLGNWNINVQSIFSTGTPYTPTDIYDKPLELGSKRMPGSKRIDARIEKYFPIISIYLDIRNIFQWNNVALVYPYSGQPDTNGRPPVFERNRYTRYIGEQDPETGRIYKSAEDAYDAHLDLWKSRLNNPYNYQSPRIIHLGINIRF